MKNAFLMERIFLWHTITTNYMAYTVLITLIRNRQQEVYLKIEMLFLKPFIKKLISHSNQCIKTTGLF